MDLRILEIFNNSYFTAIFLHVNMVMLHVDITTLHVNIFILHVNIFDRKLTSMKGAEICNHNNNTLSSRNHGKTLRISCKIELNSILKYTYTLYHLNQWILFQMDLYYSRKYQNAVPFMFRETFLLYSCMFTYCHT